MEFEEREREKEERERTFPMVDVGAKRGILRVLLSCKQQYK